MVFGIFGMILGAVLIIIGGYLVFVFPSSQLTPDDFSMSGIIIGIIFLIFGGILIFF